MKPLSLGLVWRISIVAGFSIATSTVQAATCDRECLRGVMTQYLDAMVANKPDSLPMARGARFTENTYEMKLGEGLWKDASAVGRYRQEIIDVREGVTGAHVVIEANGAPVLLAVRLKVVDGKITEVETQTARNAKEGFLFKPEGLTTLHPGLNTKPATRVSREEMIRTADYYPVGMSLGNFVAAGAPFAADAYRYENGILMAGKGCAFKPPACEDIKGQTFKPPSKLTYRILAVDEDLGIVWMRMNLGDRGEPNQTHDLIAFEFFKVHDGQFHGIEAFLRLDPAGRTSGWDAIYPPLAPKKPKQ
jgi:hypothetical protein